MTDQLMTAADVATRLKMSEHWVRRHRRSLGAVYLGRALRFPQESVEKLCTSRLQPGIMPGAERPPKQARGGDEMLRRSRYQEGSVRMYKGVRTKVWYGLWREDVLTSGGLVRRQR